MAVDERTWSRAHPEPQSSVAGDRLTLWNYPVARAELAADHQVAIRRFAAVGMLSPGTSTVQLSVRGHASATGEGSGNIDLSRRRAEGVGKYLHDLGFRAVDVSWAGSSEPADPASSGQALARNRRVELTMFVPPLVGTPRPPVPLSLGQPEAQAPPPSAPGTPDVSGAFEGAYVAKLGTLTTAAVVIDVAIDGTLKGKVTGKKGAVGASAVLKDGKWSVKFEEKLRGDLKAKLGVEPPSDGKPAKIKLGLQAEKWLLEPEVGVQADPKFVFLSLTLVKARLPDVVLDDVTASLEFTGKLKLDIGPSPALAARLAPYAAPAVEVVATGAAGAAVVAGVLVVAAVIIGGTIYASEEARREGLRFAETLARRDGAASRAALEALGGEALVAFKQRQLEWRKGEAATGTAFAGGVSLVETLLRGLGPDQRSARAKAWSEAHAKDAGAADFTLVRERIFLRLGGYEKGDDLKDRLGRL